MHHVTTLLRAISMQKPYPNLKTMHKALPIAKNCCPQYQERQRKFQTKELERRHQQQYAICLEYEQRSHQIGRAHTTILFTIIRAWPETEDLSMYSDQQ